MRLLQYPCLAARPFRIKGIGDRCSDVRRLLSNLSTRVAALDGGFGCAAAGSSARSASAAVRTTFVL